MRRFRQLFLVVFDALLRWLGGRQKVSLPFSSTRMTSLSVSPTFIGRCRRAMVDPSTLTDQDWHQITAVWLSIMHAVESLFVGASAGTVTRVVTSSRTYRRYAQNSRSVPMLFFTARTSCTVRTRWPSATMALALPSPSSTSAADERSKHATTS